MHHWHASDRHCRVFLVYSPGGHRRELELICQDLRISEALCATFPPLQAIRFRWDDSRVAIARLTHPRRNPWRLVRNVAESVALIVRFRPCVIITSGADVAVPSFVLGKLIFRRRTIFIESAGTIGPTLSGRLCKPFADLMLVQWPEQHAAHKGSILLPEALL